MRVPGCDGITEYQFEMLILLSEEIIYGDEELDNIECPEVFSKVKKVLETLEKRELAWSDDYGDYRLTEFGEEIADKLREKYDDAIREVGLV